VSKSAFRILLVLALLLCKNGFCQTLTPSEILTILRANPPSIGDEGQRGTAILALDEYLSDDATRTDPDIIAFYEDMMAFVNSEVSLSAPGVVRIWSMYNHGFIVKTPSAVFAFDLIDAYFGWTYQIPDAVLEQIDALFVSHSHGDHCDPRVISSITGFGGEVIAPSEHDYGTIPLSPNEEVTVAGLHVKAHDGLHSVPVRMYEVTTLEGITIMHTGDNQTSTTLPDGLNIDVLLLNAWVDMRNCVDKLTPLVTIPGHFQELWHSASGRVPFATGLLLAQEPELPGEVSVQAWGERYDFTVDYDGDGLPDWAETGTGVYVDETDTGTDLDDPDTDRDGLTDGDEVYTNSTDPNDADTDNDGMPDGWEVDNLLDPLADDSSEDPDGEGLTNLDECAAGTDPNATDTDGDGHPDDSEIRHGSDPLDPASRPVRGGSGEPCFIATAAYGTSAAREVGILCEFRDRYLLTNRLGSAFVRAYYRLSPPVARFVYGRPLTRNLVRTGLVPVVLLAEAAIPWPVAAVLLCVGVLVRGRRTHKRR